MNDKCFIVNRLYLLHYDPFRPNTVCNFYLSLSLPISSVLFFSSIHIVVRFPGIPPMCIYTPNSAIPGIRCQLCVHTCRGGSHLWTLHCPVHEPHQDDCKERCLQTCQEHWGYVMRTLEKSERSQQKTPLMPLKYHQSHRTSQWLIYFKLSEVSSASIAVEHSTRPLFFQLVWSLVCLFYWRSFKAIVAWQRVVPRFVSCVNALVLF